jgi:hypothetical protein
MKQIIVRILKWLGLVLGLAVIVLAMYVFRTWDRTWDAPLPDLHASADPAMIARGEYLVARFRHGGRKYAGSPMPWECFGKLTAEDAGALYEFLHSVPAAGQPSPQEPTVKQGAD